MTNNLLLESISRFRYHFGSDPTAAAYAPGRVEILGNHTDYNGGYVMAAAIDKGTVIVGNSAENSDIHLFASDLNRSAQYSAKGFVRDSRNSWSNYVLGVVEQLQKRENPVDGFRASIKSDVPIGAGLSSSAAMEVATALLLKQLYPYDLDKMSIAQLCQRAENEFVGVSSGLLDPFSSVFGEPYHLLFLDCVTHEHEQIPLPRHDLSLVICDSLAKHSLVGGDYNTRRAECMAAAAFFHKSLLRDVSVEEFDALKSELLDNERKRAQHILDENARVLAARVALKTGDADALGRLMTASHMSSRTLFENSTPELDFLVNTANALPGCLGSRLTGGGWGGATVNLVENVHVDEFKTKLAETYRTHTGKLPPIFVSAISDGAHVLPV
jgi:galactokinase